MECGFKKQVMDIQNSPDFTSINACPEEIKP